MANGWKPLGDSISVQRNVSPAVHFAPCLQLQMALSNPCYTDEIDKIGNTYRTKV